MGNQRLIDAIIPILSPMPERADDLIKNMDAALSVLVHAPGKAYERWPTCRRTCARHSSGGSSGCPRPAELLPGLAVGDVRAVSADLDAAMMASMLNHLTAVSGGHSSGLRRAQPMSELADRATTSESRGAARR